MNLELDQDGHLVDYTIWNPEVAQELAKSLDLELTDWHFEVLAAVRQFYQQFFPCTPFPSTSKELHFLPLVWLCSAYFW